jgi:hypothetical protein
LQTQELKPITLEVSDRVLKDYKKLEDLLSENRLPTAVSTTAHLHKNFNPLRREAGKKLSL